MLQYPNIYKTTTLYYPMIIPDFVHVIAITFTVLIVTELLMVVATVRTWHWLMAVAQVQSHTHSLSLPRLHGSCSSTVTLSVSLSLVFHLSTICLPLQTKLHTIYTMQLCEILVIPSRTGKGPPIKNVRKILPIFDPLPLVRRCPHPTVVKIRGWCGN